MIKNELNMNNKKLKLAFLGGGINSAVGCTHRIAIEMDKRYELVAGCFSRHEDINIKTCEEYGVNPQRLYRDLEELIINEKNNIDAICILTPTPNHRNEVINCIKNGIPVICEKALAISSAQAVEIKKALEDHNGFLVVTYNYTGYPMLRELKNMIKKNKLGKINQVHIEMPQETFVKVDKEGNPQKPQKWRLEDNEFPTISLDLGTHTHDITSFLTNEYPLELVAVQNSFGSFKEVADNVISIVQYTNDIVSNIWYSKSALGDRNGLKVRIYGEKGSAQWYQMDPENLYFNDNKGNRSIIDRASENTSISKELRYNRFKAGHPSGFIEAFANYYCDIADLLHGKTKNDDRYVFGIDEAIEGLKMLEAISRSSKSKCWVNIDE